VLVELVLACCELCLRILIDDHGFELQSRLWFGCIPYSSARICSGTIGGGMLANMSN